MLIALYFDDLLIAGSSLEAVTWIKGELSKLFEMKDLGEAKVFLGIEISRNRSQRTLHLSQQKYMQHILERFGMHNSKPVPTPMEPKLITHRWSDPSAEYELARSCSQW